MFEQARTRVPFTLKLPDYGGSVGEGVLSRQDVNSRNQTLPSRGRQRTAEALQKVGSTKVHQVFSHRNYTNNIYGLQSSFCFLLLPGSCRLTPLLLPVLLSCALFLWLPLLLSLQRGCQQLCSSERQEAKRKTGVH